MSFYDDWGANLTSLKRDQVELLKTQMSLMRNQTMIDMSVHVNDSGRNDEEEKSDDSVHTDEDIE